jgi:serine protease inhibitor
MKTRFRTPNFASRTGSLLATGLILVSSKTIGAPSPDLAKLADANNGFAFTLVKELAKGKPGENIFISPYSISGALQMVRAGAAGETRREMDEVLGTKEFSGDSLAGAYKELDQAIHAGASNAVLSVANAIWYAPNIQLRPEFVSVNKDFYGARLSALDFTDPRASGIVNKWVDEQTHGKIKRIVEGPLSGLTGAFLANAIYFKGSWEKKFEQKDTEDRVFNLAYGQQKTVPMMRQKREFLYQDAPGFQAVDLDYAGSRLRMCLLLPKANSSPRKLLEGMEAETWKTSVIPKFGRRQGTLLLPRFKLEYGAELKQPLAGLGMKRAFYRAADFSAMSATPLFVEAVKHKSFVEMNEEGTEAAAVTGVIMHATAVRPEGQPFQMVVDRPFLFVIEDAPTHSILFLGLVLDPTGN